MLLQRMNMYILILLISTIPCCSKHHISILWDRSVSNMLSISGFIDLYMEVNKQYPLSLEELNEYHTHKRDWIDVWGNDYIYYSDGEYYILISKGRDVDNPIDDNIIFRDDTYEYKRFYHPSKEYQY